MFNGLSIANAMTIAAMGGFVDGSDRICGRYFSAIRGSLVEATICCEFSTAFRSLLTQVLLNEDNFTNLRSTSVQIIYIVSRLSNVSLLSSKSHNFC